MRPALRSSLPPGQGRGRGLRHHRPCGAAVAAHRLPHGLWLCRRYVSSSYARNADFTLHNCSFLPETSLFVPLVCINQKEGKAVFVLLEIQLARVPKWRDDLFAAVVLFTRAISWDSHVSLNLEEIPFYSKKQHTYLSHICALLWESKKDFTRL